MSQWNFKEDFAYLWLHHTQLLRIFLQVTHGMVVVAFAIKYIVFHQNVTYHEELKMEDVNWYIVGGMGSVAIVAMAVICWKFLKIITEYMSRIPIAVANIFTSTFFLIWLLRRCHRYLDMASFMASIFTINAILIVALFSKKIPEILKKASLSISIALFVITLLKTVPALPLWILILLAPVFDFWSVFRGPTKNFLSQDSTFNEIKIDVGHIQSRPACHILEKHEINLGDGDQFCYCLLVGLTSMTYNWMGVLACFVGLIVGFCAMFLIFGRRFDRFPAFPAVYFGLIGLMLHDALNYVCEANKMVPI
ncbi:hypothetical protein L596_013239 [Steinernema carpocapsae]|uniref:Presenilin n=1 Tax=Steinernema carpocapsae TaxID=34508 RepID=A0A4U5P0E8_STECR|nr:hypothetical protein L596_013239 [Steinernema carpocapsae]